MPRSGGIIGNVIEESNKRIIVISVLKYSCPNLGIPDGRPAKNNFGMRIHIRKAYIQNALTKYTGNVVHLSAR